MAAKYCPFGWSFSAITLVTVLSVGSAVAQEAEQDCALIARLPVSAHSLYSDLLDQRHGSYFMAQSGSALRVFRVEKVQGVFNIIEAPPAISIPDAAISPVFHGDDILVAQAQSGASNGSSFVTPEWLSRIPAYSLSQQTEVLQRSFEIPSQSNMTPRGAWPFWGKHAPYSSWEGRACPGPTSGQLGRLIAPLGASSLVVANNFEFSAGYFDQPYSCGQQRYERNPDGSTKMRVARDYSSVTHPFFCDLVRPRPEVLGCQKVGTYESPGCVEITPTPTPTPSPTPTVAGTPPAVTPAATATPQPPPPPACAVRMEPDPIENVAGQEPEFCPTCEYYWWAMDPAFSIYNRNAAGAMVKTGQFYFPQQFGNEHIEIPISESEFTLGEIVQLRAHSRDGGFAAAVQLSAESYPELSGSGGVFFFDASGSFTGFTSAFFENGGTGTTLAAIGGFEGRAVYASGSPNNAIFHPELSEYPEEWTQTFRPQAGHMIFTKDNGELLSIQFGAADGDSFGSSVAGLGDVDGDGMPEALIGAAGGAYAVVVSAAGPSSGLLRFEGEPLSQFGRLVGTLSTQHNGKPDVAIIGSSSDLSVYDLSTCLPLAALSEQYRLQIVDEALSALLALQQLEVPEPPLLAAAATFTLSELNWRIRNLLALLRLHPVIPGAAARAAALDQFSISLNEALRLHSEKQTQFAEAADKSSALNSKIKKLKKKKKKARGYLAATDIRKLKKTKNHLRVLNQEQAQRMEDIAQAGASARASKQDMVAELNRLLEAGGE